MIYLLTIEEARKIPGDILRCKVPKDFNGFIGNKNKCNWWLRSPGRRSWSAAVVLASDDVYDDVYDYGYDVRYDFCAVRPVLRIEESLINTLPRTKKGYVMFLGTKWIDISEYVGSPCLLKKKCMKEAHRFDGKSNNYDQSEVKKFIEDWYRRRVKKNGEE